MRREANAIRVIRCLGKRAGAAFRYSSDTNDRWLSASEMQDLARG